MTTINIVPRSRVISVRDSEHAFDLLRDFRPDLDDAQRRAFAVELADGFALLVVEDDFELLDAAVPAAEELQPLDPDDIRPDGAPVPSPATEKTWIEVQVLGLNGESYAGAGIRLRLADGTVSAAALDAASSWATHELEASGTCHVELAADARVNEEVAPLIGFVPQPMHPRLRPGASVGLASGRQHTLVVKDTRASCARLVGMMFALNKAFILPEALEGIRLVRHMYEIQPTAEVLLVGHTDTTGHAWRNRSLSLARAEAVLAYLSDDVEHWYALYTADTDYSRRWGDAEDLAMLGALPFGNTPFYGEHHEVHSLSAAVARYQEARGLVVDGDAGEQTRKALIAEYMAADGTSLPHDVPALAHGCGQNFPAVPTEDGVEELENRRVEVFFFRDGIQPRPGGDVSAAGSAAYPAWLDTVDQERTFRPSEAGIGSLLLVTDIEAEFAEDADVEFTLKSTDGAYEATLRADAHGQTVYGYVELMFAELPKGSFYTLVMRDHEGTEQILFEDISFWELSGVGDPAGEDFVDPFTLEVGDS